MMFRFENIGPVDHAEIALGDLTIVAGRNNTGKTYLVYALYGFLKHLQAWSLADSAYAPRATGPDNPLTHVLPLRHVAKQLAASGRAILRVTPTQLAETRHEIADLFRPRFFEDDLGHRLQFHIGSLWRRPNVCRFWSSGSGPGTLCDRTGSFRSQTLDAIRWPESHHRHGHRTRKLLPQPRPYFFGYSKLLSSVSFLRSPSRADVSRRISQGDALDATSGLSDVFVHHDRLYVTDNRKCGPDRYGT